MKSHVDEDSLTETTQRLNLNSSYAASGVSDVGDKKDSPRTGGVWIELPHSGSQNDENSISKGKGQDHLYAGLDSPEAGSVDPESPRSIPPPFTEKKDSKFAKVPVSYAPEP